MKKSKKVLIIISFLALALWGCNNKRETLLKEIYAIHDEVMPKRDEVIKLKKATMKYKDITEDVDKRMALVDSYMLLASADDGMMDWMASFKAPEKNADETEMIEYLEAEKKKIQAVSDTIYLSIKQAQSLLADAPDSLKVK